MQVMHGTSGPIRFDGTRRGWRAVVGLFAALAVFAALFHCMCAVADPAAPLQASVVAIAAGGPCSDLPDAPAHVHCAHCLCHAGYQGLAAAHSLPNIFEAPAYTLLQGQDTRLLSGLPPFKPPRA